MNLKINPLKHILFLLHIRYLAQIFPTATSHQKLELDYSSVGECFQRATGATYKRTQRKRHTPSVFKPMKNNYEPKLSLKSHFNSNCPPTQGKETHVGFKRPKQEIKKQLMSIKQKIFYIT